MNPPVTTRSRILDAARQIFSARGYGGATTRAIAAAAGVNELTLFRTFQSKKNLFLEVIRTYSNLPAFQADLAGRLNGDPAHDLQLIGGAFFGGLMQNREGILLFLKEADQFPEVMQASAFVPQAQREMLAGYMEGQMQAGRMRRMNPQLAAQAYLGMFFAYVLSLNWMPELAPGEINQAEIVQAFTSIFLDGMRVTHESN
jgi:AcrR family transcriptional regulator